jgi:hypothetical protein
MGKLASDLPLDIALEATPTPQTVYAESRASFALISKEVYTTKESPKI